MHGVDSSRIGPRDLSPAVNMDLFFLVFYKSRCGSVHAQQTQVETLHHVAYLTIWQDCLSSF